MKSLSLSFSLSLTLYIYLSVYRSMNLTISFSLCGCMSVYLPTYQFMYQQPNNQPFNQFHYHHYLGLCDGPLCPIVSMLAVIFLSWAHSISALIGFLLRAANDSLVRLIRLSMEEAATGGGTCAVNFDQCSEENVAAAIATLPELLPSSVSATC